MGVTSPHPCPSSNHIESEAKRPPRCTGGPPVGSVNNSRVCLMPGVPPSTWEWLGRGTRPSTTEPRSSRPSRSCVPPRRRSERTAAASWLIMSVSSAGVTMTASPSASARGARDPSRAVGASVICTRRLGHGRIVSGVLAPERGVRAPSTVSRKAVAKRGPTASAADPLSKLLQRSITRRRKTDTRPARAPWLDAPRSLAAPPSRPCARL